MAADSQEMGCLERILGILSSLITIYTFLVSIGPAGTNMVPFRAPAVIAVMSSLSLPSRSLLAIVIQAALARFFLTSCLIAEKAKSAATYLVGMIVAASLTGWLTLFNTEMLLIKREGHLLVFLVVIFVGLAINFLVVLAEDEGLAGATFLPQTGVFIVIAVSSVVAK
jgi:hypothetical protein